MGDSLRFCCCTGMTCHDDREDSSLNDCGNTCDTYVTVMLPDCKPVEDCEISTAIGTIEDSPSVSTFGYIFSFDMDKVPYEVGHYIISLMYLSALLLPVTEINLN